MAMANAVLSGAKHWGRVYLRNMGGALWWWFKVCMTLEIAIYFAGCCHYERWLSVDEWLALMDNVMRWVTAGAS